jgi:hypothetical protein
MASVDCYTRFGIATTASPVAWAGGGGSRNVVDWIPRIDEAVIDERTGRFNPRWYNYLRALGDRLGGVQGPSIPQIQSTVTATQSQVAETLNYSVQVADYATQVAATATATAEVASNNSLSGSGSIPPTGSPPNRPNINYQVE